MQSTADRPLAHPWMRPVYFLLGMIFLLVGVAGVALPLVPTTGPVLLAAFFFARSSHRFHDWLIGHPRFGPLISDFRAGRGIPRAVKAWALAAMTAAFGLSAVFITTNWIARAAVVAVAIGAIGYVARLPASSR